jgi:glycogen debranching enzyme
MASNAGHLLWSGICAPDRAARVADRLFSPEFYSGWGIRTLPEGHPSYNPHSYHNGSVWPHDNGIIALGFKRYGFNDKIGKVARDISRAASYFTSNRLPELYAGVARTPDNFPVQYVQANVPQAWAAGSAFHLLSAILGLQADAASGALYVDPHLPKWLPDVKLAGIAVGGAKVDLSFWREGEESKWEAKMAAGEIRVEQRAWAPWGL